MIALILATARDLLCGRRALILLLSPLLAAAFVAATELATGTGAGLRADLAELGHTWCRHLAFPAALVLGAGVIAGPLRSGEMVLWAVRPITFPAIVLARFAGTWAAALAVLLVPWALGLVLAIGSLPTADLVTAPLHAALTSAAVLAPLVLLSVVLPLAGDALAYVTILVGLLLAKGQLTGSAQRALDWLVRFVFPSSDFLDTLVATGSCPPHEPLRWAGLVSASLLAACVLLSRKELHYGRLD